MNFLLLLYLLNGTERMLERLKKNSTLLWYLWEYNWYQHSGDNQAKNMKRLKNMYAGFPEM